VGAALTAPLPHLGDASFGSHDRAGRRALNAEGHDSERRRRVRRSALLFGGIALAFYLSFIVMSVVRSLP